MIIISTSLTVPGQPSPRFHIESWLPFRNCEILYSVCASAGYLGMHRRMSIWFAQAQVRFSCASAAHFLPERRAFVCYPITQVLFETHFKLFPGNLLFFKLLTVIFFHLKFVLFQSHLIILECVSCPLTNFGQQITGKTL